MEKLTKVAIFQFLLDLLKENPKGLTFDEIHNEWEDHWENYLEYNEEEEDGPKFTELKKRTFHRYKKEIKELFGIKIVCDKVGEIEDDYRYRVKGLKKVDIDMLMLGDAFSKTEASVGSMTFRIIVDDNALGWMRNLLSKMKHILPNGYNEKERPDGTVFFQFEAPYMDIIARAMLPYVDSIHIETPSALDKKIDDLLKRAISQREERRRKNK